MVKCVIWAIVFSAMGLGFCQQPAFAAEGILANAGQISVDVADLKEQLENGLRARLPQEYAFIARVIALVRTGQMSSEMVTSTYNWARLKHPRPYPYPYFEAALRMRAREIGIDL